MDQSRHGGMGHLTVEGVTIKGSGSFMDPKVGEEYEGQVRGKGLEWKISRY